MPKNIFYICDICGDIVFTGDKCKNGHDIKEFGKKIDVDKYEYIKITDNLINRIFYKYLNSKTKYDEILNLSKLIKLFDRDEKRVIDTALNIIKNKKYDIAKMTDFAFFFDHFQKNSKFSDILFKTLVEFNSNKTAFLNNYAIYLYNNGKYEESLNNFLKAYTIEYNEKGEKYASNSISYKNIMKFALRLNQADKLFEELGQILKGDKREENINGI